MQMSLVLLLALSLFFQSTFGEIICEELPAERCSFSIASSGKRCLLETYVESGEGSNEFQCKTSEIIAKNFSDLIESDECISACGVDRKSIGISSDLLLEPAFTTKLCSPQCYQNCPNIVELYYNLALGEGVFLPDLCQLQRSMPRRAMSQLLRSSGKASAAAPMMTVTAAGPGSATAEAPMSMDLVAYPPTFM